MPTFSLPKKKTKIVCTVGPATQTQEKLEALILAGMNIARINFAHGDLDGHRQAIANIRAAAAATGQRVAIMGDLPGPKMRIGRLDRESIDLEVGAPFTLLVDDIAGDARRVSMSFSELPNVVAPGDLIFVNDGFIQLSVQSVEARAVHCLVDVGGELRAHKGVNFPGIDLGIDAFTEQDQTFLHFAAEQGLDAVSQSFVQNGADILAVREAAEELGYHPFIIAKIERARAVENIEDILAVCDGIMVARGDLGVETPIERVALIQKQIITAASRYSRPVITATHMLESMVLNRRPTRAEATDVANAIIDGTDCVMLSGETAIGRYPVEAVSIMTRIAEATEDDYKEHFVAKLLQLERMRGKIDREDLVSLSIYLTVEALSPALVFTPTSSGATTRRVTRFHLQPWIIGISQFEQTCQNLQFCYGVIPLHEPDRPDIWTEYVRTCLQGLEIGGDLVVIASGTRRLSPGGMKRIDIIDLSQAPSE